MDWESVAAGLLHDTVEDTNVVTFERIEEEFGTTVRQIVEGETKVVWSLILYEVSQVPTPQHPPSRNSYQLMANLLLTIIQVSKLGKLKAKDDNHSVQDVKADDLRQMFLAMTEEVIYSISVMNVA